jgi:ParB family chromosome partitioning protein
VQILNPRLREKRRFGEIVENIKTIGLKRPITVRARRGPEANYEVVCGQGRFEAFKAAGASHIPAIVCDYTRPQALLASLVENIARRPVRAIEQIRSIQWMKDQGHDSKRISQKTGLAKSYVDAILRLLEKGEDRLLDAALHGRVPITIATRIAESGDQDVQRVLMEAYQGGEIKQKTLSEFRRLVQMRKCWGKKVDNGGARAKRNSTEVFVTRHRQLAERHKLLIRKARAVEGRLLAVTAAFRTLLGDENFRVLLRAEDLGTMPRYLAEAIRDPS